MKSWWKSTVCQRLHTLSSAESEPSGSAQKNVLISGASGLIGRALTDALVNSGFRVFALSRTNPEAPFYFDQKKGSMHLDSDISLFAVVNLAGANISAKRWSAATKRQILESRRHTTALLAAALAALPNKPQVFLSASAVGYYGDTGATVVDENSPAGSGFLSQVSVDWERATAPAEGAGIRAVYLRFGLVLSPEGGVLKNFILPLGLASVGPVGEGTQFMSWISIVDAVAIIQRLMVNSDVSGPVNLVAPEIVSNAQFMKELSQTLHSLQLPRLPSAIVRLMFGEMADAALLSSSRVKSRMLPALGLQLQYPELAGALKALLKR